MNINFIVIYKLFHRVTDTSAKGFNTRNFGFRSLSFADVKKLAVKMINAGGLDGDHHSPLIVWRDQNK